MTDLSFIRSAFTSRRASCSHLASPVLSFSAKHSLSPHSKAQRHHIEKLPQLMMASLTVAARLAGNGRAEEFDGTRISYTLKHVSKGAIMPLRKVVSSSPPPVVVRKKKTQRPTNETTAKPVPHPAPTPAAEPSPPSPRPAESESLPSQAQPSLVAPQPMQTSPPPNHRQRDAQAQRELLATLRARWPVAFSQDPHHVRPLAKGIHREIATHLSGTSLSLIKRAIVLFQRLSGGAYWRAVLKGGPRYALDGSPCGEITLHEQEHARQTLALWKEQRAAKRPANTNRSSTVVSS